MKYFKDKNKNVYAYETREDYLNFGSSSFVEMSTEEVSQHITKSKELEEETKERVWRNIEINRADIELNKVQDSDPKAKGAVSQWREYRKALRAWPEHADFPNKEKRPVAPDA